MSSQIAINVISGLIVAILAYWFGFGGSTRVVVSNGANTSKRGKWLIILGWVGIFIGATMFVKTDSTQWGYNLDVPRNLYAFTVMAWSVIILVTGKMINWFNK